MKEKQKTCITVLHNGNAINQFTKFLNIPHRVDIIKITGIGGEIYNDPGGGAVLVNDAFYITSDLVTNYNDNILGIFGNFTYAFSDSGKKTFINNSGSIYGTYTFYLYQFKNRILNTYNDSVTVYINIEFIELEK